MEFFPHTTDSFHLQSKARRIPKPISVPADSEKNRKQVPLGDDRLAAAGETSVVPAAAALWSELGGIFAFQIRTKNGTESFCQRTTHFCFTPYKSLAGLAKTSRTELVRFDFQDLPSTGS